MAGGGIRFKFSIGFIFHFTEFVSFHSQYFVGLLIDGPYRKLLKGVKLPFLHQVRLGPRKSKNGKIDGKITLAIKAYNRIYKEHVIRYYYPF